MGTSPVPTDITNVREHLRRRDNEAQLTLEGLLEEIGLFVSVLQFHVQIGKGARPEQNGPGMFIAQFRFDGQAQDAPIVIEIERVGDAQKGGEGRNASARGTTERDKLLVLSARQCAAMVARDTGDLEALL